MILNFERFQEIQKQANSESYCSLSHVEPRNLPRCHKPGIRWSGSFFVHFFYQFRWNKTIIFWKWNNGLISSFNYSSSISPRGCGCSAVQFNISCYTLGPAKQPWPEWWPSRLQGKGPSLNYVRFFFLLFKYPS